MRDPSVLKAFYKGRRDDAMRWAREQHTLLANRTVPAHNTTIENARLDAIATTLLEAKYWHRKMLRLR